VTSGAFFHAVDHCELLAAQILPALAARRAIQLWAAGCAAGEDAWSLAMLVEEARLPAGVAVHILATERDPALLARAGEAVYPDHVVERVAPERRRRHFVRGVGPRRGLWRVIAPLRDRVELAALDLHGPWPALGVFDVVCGHGAFAALEQTGELARRFAAVLAPGGVLLGAPATIADDVPALEPVGAGVFRRPAR